MRIQTKTVFIVGNCEFDSENKARAWIYDQIGNLMSKALSDAGVGAIGPRERIAIVDAMSKNAAQLATLLDAYRSKVEELD